MGGAVEGVGERRNACSVLVCKPVGGKEGDRMEEIGQNERMY
jgi:hypothetical protein